MRKNVWAVLVGLIASLQASAVSVSLLNGGTFRDDLGYDKNKTTMTIENFAVWEYGTVFFYYDITEPFSDNKGDSNQFFGGISPTLSLSKVTGQDWSYGIIRDVSLRFELENGSGYGANNFRTYFFGLQYDLAIPGFDFFSFNTVLRDNPSDRGVGFQFGMFWQMTWDYGPWRRFKFTGFMATSPWDGDQNPDNKFFGNRGRFLSSAPQFLYDLGYGWFGKPNRVEVGTELAYYVNRYTIHGKDETCLQAMTKISF